MSLVCVYLIHLLCCLDLLSKYGHSFHCDTAVTSFIPFAHLKAKHVLILSHCVGTHSVVGITFRRC